jgi:hypothetical protein
VLHPDEPGHQRWTFAEGMAWYDALQFEGSRYVGNLGRILNRYATHGAEPNWRLVPARRGLYSPGRLFVLYLSVGGDPWTPSAGKLPRRYRIYDPKTGEVVEESTLPEAASVIRTGRSEPTVVVFFDPEAEQG